MTAAAGVDHAAFLFGRLQGLFPFRLPVLGGVNGTGQGLQRDQESKEESLDSRVHGNDGSVIHQLVIAFTLVFSQRTATHEFPRWKNSIALPQTILCFSAFGTPVKFRSMMFSD